MFSWLREQWDKFSARYEARHPRPFGEEHLSDDVYLVIKASSDLDIPEFELFVKAFEKWFGESAEEQRIEKYYLGYMFCGRVPHWVREYCRRVADDARRHELDPVKFGVLPSMTRRAKVGLTMLAVAFGIMVALFTIADYTVEHHYQNLRALSKQYITYRP